MITVVYGMPGSGKTFYSVWWIKRRCLEESDIFFRVRKDVILITNIKLNLDSPENYVFIQDWAEWRKYMDVEYWTSNLANIQGKRIVMVMDEAQVFFQVYRDHPGVMFFLQYHRHLSVDVLLITQSPKSLPQKVLELAEYLVEAVPRSINPFGFKAFRYRVIHPFDRSIVLRRFHLTYDPTIFYLYSDMIYKPPEEGEKPKNTFTRYYVLLAGFLIFTLVMLFSFVSRVFSPKEYTQAQSTQTTQTATQTRTISYEDLIVEVPEEPQEPKQEPPKEEPKEEPKPIETRGYYHISVEKTPPKTESIDLSPGPKIIYLP